MNRIQGVHVFAFILIMCLALGNGIGNSVYAQDASQKTVLKVSTDSKEAESMFWQGMHDRQNAYLDRASEFFEKSVSIDPEFTIAAFMHARTNPTLTPLERRKMMRSLLPELANTSVEEHLIAAGTLEAYEGRRFNAKILFEAASKLLPDEPNTALLAATVTGSPASRERIRALETVVKRFPDFAAAYNYLAYALWYAGDTGGGLSAVGQYAQLLPDHPNATDSYAELYKLSGMYDEAADYYHKTLDLDDSYRGAYTGLAEIQVLSGNGNEARKYLADGKLLAPTEDLAINFLRAEAASFLMEGNIDEGADKLLEAGKQLIGRERSDLAALAYRELALVESIRGRIETAQTYLERAYAIEPDDLNQEAWRALVYGVNGNARITKEAADKFRELRPDNDDMWIHIFDALAYLAAGNAEAAEEAIMRGDLAYVWSKAVMAMCQRELGHEAAAKHWEQLTLNNTEFLSHSLLHATARLNVLLSAKPGI